MTDGKGSGCHSKGPKWEGNAMWFLLAEVTVAVVFQEQ